jgi:hypothetical protein
MAIYYRSLIRIQAVWGQIIPFRYTHARGPNIIVPLYAYRLFRSDIIVPLYACRLFKAKYYHSAIRIQDV